MIQLMDELTQKKKLKKSLNSKCDNIAQKPKVLFSAYI